MGLPVEDVSVTAALAGDSIGAGLAAVKTILQEMQKSRDSGSNLSVALRY